MKKLTINKGWYWGAGSNWGWKADGVSIVGIGIARQWFNEKEIIVEVDGKNYKLDCAKAKEFINKYKCFEQLKGSRIGYISKDLLEEIPLLTNKDTQ